MPSFGALIASLTRGFAERESAAFHEGACPPAARRRWWAAPSSPLPGVAATHFEDPDL